MARVGPLADCVGPAAGRVVPAAGCVEPAASCVEPAASCVGPAASCVGPAATRQGSFKWLKVWVYSHMTLRGRRQRPPLWVAFTLPWRHGAGNAFFARAGTPHPVGSRTVWLCFCLRRGLSLSRLRERVPARAGEGVVVAPQAGERHSTKLWKFWKSGKLFVGGGAFAEN